LGLASQQASQPDVIPVVTPEQGHKFSQYCLLHACASANVPICIFAQIVVAAVESSQLLLGISGLAASLVCFRLHLI